jgi:hypothetical protein
MAVSTERVDQRLAIHVRPLAARNALRSTALLAGIHGLVLLAAPGFGLSLFDAAPAGEATYWLRNSGLLFLALAVVFWAAARWPASMMQRPVLLAAGIITAGLSLLGVLTVLDGTVSLAFVAVLAVEALLATWIWWLLLTDGV